MAGCILMKGERNGTITYFETLEETMEWVQLYVDRYTTDQKLPALEDILPLIPEKDGVKQILYVVDPELEIWLFRGTEDPFYCSAYPYDTVDSQTGLSLGPKDTLSAYVARWNAAEYDDEDERGSQRWVYD
jgi:hypothetical protein